MHARRPVLVSALRLMGALLGALALASGCTGSAGLVCRDGEFFMNGQEFTDCRTQCSDPSDCAFTTRKSCSYPGGVQHCTTVWVRACCAGECVRVSGGTCSEEPRPDASAPRLDGPPVKVDGGGKADAKPASDASGGIFSGTWKGQWSAAQFSGALTLVLAHSGATVTGQATFGGSPCISTATIDATVTGNSASGTITASFGSPTKGVFSGSLDGTKLTGTFQLTAGACSGTSGTCTLTRK